MVGEAVEATPSGDGRGDEVIELQLWPWEAKPSGRGRGREAVAPWPWRRGHRALAVAVGGEAIGTLAMEAKPSHRGR